MREGGEREEKGAEEGWREEREERKYRKRKERGRREEKI